MATKKEIRERLCALMSDIGASKGRGGFICFCGEKNIPDNSCGERENEDMATLNEVEQHLREWYGIEKKEKKDAGK